MDEQNQNPSPADEPTQPMQQPNPDPIYGNSPAPTATPSYMPISVPTNSLAIVSLVSSILSWVLLPFVGGIIGLVTGIMARKEIKLSNGAQGGDGLAVTGIIVGALNIVFMCLAAVCFGVFIVTLITTDGFTR